MRFDLSGEPIHVRAHSVAVSLRADGRLDACGSLIDLRTRGFLPVGGNLQGMGIIHHMELRWAVDPVSGVIETFAASQPTVAFEAGPETGGESCRDPIARVADLGGARLGEGLSRVLRDRIGGALGCSHLVTLALFMDGAVRNGLVTQRALDPARLAGAPGVLFRRDLVVDAHERADGEVAVVLRQGDVHWNAVSPTALAPERFALHHECVAQIVAHLWPGELRSIAGSERRRTATGFTAPWVDHGARLASLLGMGLARGAAGELVRRLGDDPDATPWVDALLMLAPALVQCRAAHPDAWHEKVRSTPQHPGLTAIPDSCYMWRRGGALERLRDSRGASRGGR